MGSDMPTGFELAVARFQAMGSDMPTGFELAGGALSGHGK
jgi:hypothetical protein